MLQTGYFVEIALFLLAGMLLVYIASRNTGQGMAAPVYDPPPNDSHTHSDSIPLIQYTVLVADPRSGQWLHIEAPDDYPHHYGILQGQYIQLRWQVLHADFIQIEGIGYVSAVGSKDLYPKQAVRYRIRARNRNHQAEQAIVVQVFPMPVMEHILPPLPDLNARIKLKINPLPSIGWPNETEFPSIQSPGLLQLRQELQPEPPKAIPLKTDLHKSSLYYNLFKNLSNNILNTKHGTTQP